MIDTLRKLIKREEGTVIVLVALGLTVFLSFTALVTDVGLLLVERGKLVQAVDAAALAGVQELPDNPTAATTKATEYAQKNGVSSPTVTISPDNKEITVESTKQVNLAFAKIWGLDKSNVKATAKAVVAPVKNVSGAVPMSILDQPLVAGQKYVIKSADGIGAYSNGWRGILNYTGGGGGSSDYRELTREGYQGRLSIGQVIDKETGNKSGPTEDGVNDRIDACDRTPPCSATDYEPDCPRLVWVPVIEEVDNKKVRVVGFAAFFLEEVEGSGNDNNVWATLVQQTMSADIDTEGTDYGLYGAKLTN
ncbi:MAG: pilus assembly protein TadG-related protein [Bacillota bacterium]